MKRLTFALLLFLCACSGKEKTYTQATDALDAGREYINALQQGDFARAAFYSLPDEKNTSILAGIEKKYREQDKEGRQTLRTASININEVKVEADGSTTIRYNYSYDKQFHVVTVVKQGGNWLVDQTKN